MERFELEEVLENTNDWVGQRVSISGTKQGVVQYFGKTHFADGIYCGVALDETTGKHNGIVQGVRYFTCPDNRGLFVPLHKITKVPAVNVTDNEKLNQRDKNCNSRLPSKIRLKMNPEANFSERFNKYFAIHDGPSDAGRLRRQSDSFMGVRYSNKNLDVNSIINNNGAGDCKPLNSSYTISRKPDTDLLNTTVTLNSISENSPVHQDKKPLESTFTLDDNAPVNTTFDANQTKVSELSMDITLSALPTNLNNNEIIAAKDSTEQDLSNESLGILSLSQMADFSISDDDVIFVNTDLSCIQEVDSYLEKDLSCNKSGSWKTDLNLNLVRPASEASFKKYQQSKEVLDRKTSVSSVDIQDFETNAKRHSTPKDLNTTTTVLGANQAVENCPEPPTVTPLDPGTRRSQHRRTADFNPLGEIQVKGKSIQIHTKDFVDFREISPVIADENLLCISEKSSIHVDVTPKTHKNANMEPVKATVLNETICRHVEDLIDLDSSLPRQIPDRSTTSIDNEGSGNRVVLNSTFGVPEVVPNKQSAKGCNASGTNGVTNLLKNEAPEHYKTFECVNEGSFINEETFPDVAFNCSTSRGHAKTTYSGAQQKVCPAVPVDPVSSNQQSSQKSRMSVPGTSQVPAKNSSTTAKTGAMTKKNVVSKIKSLLESKKDKKPEPPPSPKRTTRPSFLKLGTANKLKGMNPVFHSTPKSPGKPNIRGVKESIKMLPLTDSTSPINRDESQDSNKTLASTAGSRPNESRILTSLNSSELNSRPSTSRVSHIGASRRKSSIQTPQEQPSPAKSTTSSKSRVSTCSRIAMLAPKIIAPAPKPEAKSQLKKTVVPPSGSISRARPQGGSLRVPSKVGNENKIVRRPSIPKFKP